MTEKGFIKHMWNTKNRFVGSHVVFCHAYILQGITIVILLVWYPKIEAVIWFLTVQPLDVIYVFNALIFMNQGIRCCQ